MTYETEEEIRRRVTKRIKARNEFYTHLVIYIAVNLLVWAIALMTGSGWWPIFVTFGWGIGVVANAADVFFGERQTDAIEREVAREKARMYGDVAFEKPKRRASLSEDGELRYSDEEIDPDAIDAEEERRERRSRRREQGSGYVCPLT